MSLRFEKRRAVPLVVLYRRLSRSRFSRAKRCSPRSKGCLHSLQGAVQCGAGLAVEYEENVEVGRLQLKLVVGLSGADNNDTEAVAKQQTKEQGRLQ